MRKKGRRRRSLYQKLAEKETELEYPYEFDEERRRKAEAYTEQKFWQYLVRSALGLAVLLGILVSGLHEQMLQVATAFGSAVYLEVPLFTVQLVGIFSLVTMPVSFYSGFVLEHRYGLSNQSVAEWAVDHLKGFLVTLLLAAVALTGLYYLVRTTTLWWLWTGVLYVLLVTVLANVAPTLILPLFYETEECRDEEVKSSLRELCEREGVEIETVEVLGASEKTEKANAAFAGLGSLKRILLTDTLLERFSTEEVRMVVAHELAHYVNKDVLRQIVVSALTLFPTLFLADLILGGVLPLFSLNLSSTSSMPLLLLVVGTLAFLLQPLQNAYSRHREREADQFSLERTGDPTAQVSALRRLGDINLSDDQVPRLLELLLYDHPPLGKRIEAAQRPRAS